MTSGKKLQKNKNKNEKKSETDTWHAVNDVNNFFLKGT